MNLHNEFKVHYDNISTHFSQLRHKTEGVSETDIQNNAKQQSEVPNAVEVLKQMS